MGPKFFHGNKSFETVVSCLHHVKRPLQMSVRVCKQFFISNNFNCLPNSHPFVGPFLYFLYWWRLWAFRRDFLPYLNSQRNPFTADFPYGWNESLGIRVEVICFNRRYLQQSYINYRMLPSPEGAQSKWKITFSPVRLASSRCRPGTT